jgi:hypothetical protein
MKTSFKSLFIDLVYKEVVEGCVYLSDKSIKRLVKYVFICQINLSEALEGCLYLTSFTGLFIDLSHR